ncbi:hypothetical protein AAKU55_005562 [Oxalobacteraceae bacterium GrIS 1.11]
MSRPAFTLADDEARLLVRALGELQILHPLDRRDHRPFVRGFIRAVHAATGRAFSPAIYRRLLAAYAPERRPSTATLALEKEVLVDELARAERAACELSALPFDNLAALVRRAVAEALASQAPPPASDSYAAARCDFLQTRLADAERAERDARAGTARLAADLQAAREVAHCHVAELDAARIAIAEQARAIARLTAAVDDARTFALKAIDEARGETRAWKERCAHADALAQRETALMETFRQLAYQRGAAIPPALRQDGTP